MNELSLKCIAETGLSGLIGLTTKRCVFTFHTLYTTPCDKPIQTMQLGTVYTRKMDWSFWSTAFWSIKAQPVCISINTLWRWYWSSSNDYGGCGALVCFVSRRLSRRENNEIAIDRRYLEPFTVIGIKRIYDHVSLFLSVCLSLSHCLCLSLSHCLCDRCLWLASTSVINRYPGTSNSTSECSIECYPCKSDLTAFKFIVLQTDFMVSKTLFVVYYVTWSKAHISLQSGL